LTDFQDCAKCHKALPEHSVSKQEPPGWAKLSAVGLELGVGVALGAIVGNWIDQKRHSSPWGVLIGAALGMAAGFYLLFKEAIKANKD
jgi:F0F1-type ATP synthase assembly protein I